MAKKRGMTPTYWKIIYDSGIVAIYKQSEETPHHRSLVKLSGCYRDLATAEEYDLFHELQEAILKPARTPS